MEQRSPTTMRAVAIDRFGEVEELSVRQLPVPEPGPSDVVIRVRVAGVGEWDPFEREGGYADMLGLTPDFPYVLGSEGAGEVVAIGDRVERLHVGDTVYAAGFLNPHGGFYAQYAAVDEALVSPVPASMSLEQAGVMSGVALTALRGLQDTLRLRDGETVAIVGASGALGHLAVQLATRSGARVLAIASGEDGVALCEKIGAEVSVDGRAGDVSAAARQLAPEGLDAVLLATGGAVAEQASAALRDGGRLAFPSGVQPEPARRPGIEVLNFNGDPDRELIDRLDRMIELAPLYVHVDRTFALADAAAAQEALAEHHLGKYALLID
jgi:NADPH:quinone reductase